LAQVLRPLSELFTQANYPNLLVGLEVSDDAAVYQVTDELAVIQTVDYFPPIVDDPYTYGAIAAANAMSDVYAMGGKVALALNIACFPEHLPVPVITEILRGGAEKVREAGAAVAGGHTIDDTEPKYGMAVMGLVHPQHIATKSAARPGDVLLLTKPLGTGIITTAAKGDAAEAEHLEAAVASMLQLNRVGAEIAPRFGLKAITDITGFALLGHAQEMAVHSHVRLHIHSQQVPLLPGARQYADAWLFPGGSKRNADYYLPNVQVSDQVPEELLMLLFTPETSGGLLVAVPPQQLGEVEAYLQEVDQAYWLIGEVDAGSGLVLD
jgi:selenide,water dikinase